MAINGCIVCSRGFLDECGCSPELDPFSGFTTIKPKNPSSPPVVNIGEKRAVGRPELPIDEVLDPRSTMRRRAQKAYAGFHPEMEKDVSPCQWLGLADVGLERHRIVGCINGVFRHVHHVNKDIFDNREENLVGICNRCHNLTHSFINPCIKRDGKGADQLKISIPRQATEEELAIWNEKAKDHLIPRANHKDCVIIESREVGPSNDPS